MSRIITADAIAGLQQLPDCSVDMCVTSPPYYGLRDYGVAGQIGQEDTPEEYVDRIVAVFREVRRVLKDDATLWLNLGDSYAGSGKGRYADGRHSEGAKQATNTGAVIGALCKTRPQGCKPKDLLGIPWMVAFALRDDGWYLRQEIIWAKTNPMPESVRDRCTKSHEHIFLLSKSKKYYFDSEEISEPVTNSTVHRLSQDVENQEGSHRIPGKTNGPMKAAAPRYGGKKYTETPDVFNRTKSNNAYDFRPRRNKRSVWTVSTQPYKGAHFATFPPELIRPCILAGSRRGGVVLDPFFGSGTTGVVAVQEGREYIGIDISHEYTAMAAERIARAK